MGLNIQTQENGTSQAIEQTAEQMHNKQMRQMREETAQLKKLNKAMKENLRLKHLPTLWIKGDRGEIHFDNKTLLFKIDSTDKETSREHSDKMAIGSLFRQINYKIEEEENA